MVQDPSRVDVSLEPLDEYLVIQPTSDETETRAGLILPASAAAAAACRTGIVTAIELLPQRRGNGYYNALPRLAVR